MNAKQYSEQPFKAAQKDIIIAGRRSNGEVLYLCQSHFVGPFWCEDAQSMAHGFDSQEKADAKAAELAPKFAGLKLETYPRLKAG